MTVLAPSPVIRSRPTSLCQLAGRWAGQMPDGGAMVERKHDGFRCLFFPGLNRQPGLWTRNGMPMPGAGHVLARLLEVEAEMGGRWMIDGEIVVDGSLKATRDHYNHRHRLGDAGTFYAFDAVPLDDWQRGRSDMLLFERKAALTRAIEATAPDAAAWEWRERSHGAGHGVDPVEMVTDVWLFDAAEVDAEAHRVWAQGHEGLVIKRADAPYIRARSDDWLKFKRPGED